jgi:hypothetical protein
MDYLIVGVVVFCCIAVPLIVRAILRRKRGEGQDGKDKPS